MTRTKHMRFVALSAITLTLNSLVAVHAVGQSADPEELIARADANEDGNISWEEVVALRSGAFDRLDRNTDGIVNSQDRPRGPLAVRFDNAFARVQADFDTDRDGELTKEEMLGAPAPMFEQGDLDADGMLTAEEMTALRAQGPQG